MKVLFIEPCFINFGGYHRAMNICPALAKQGIHVDLLLTSDKKFFFKIGKTVVNEYLTIYELPRITLNFYITGRILRGIIALIFGLLNSYDIIHAAMPSQFESNIPAFYLKLLGKKVVIDWDDICEESFIVHPLVSAYIKFWEHLGPKFFNNYCAASDVLYQMAIDRGAKNVIKIINGISVEPYPKHNKLKSRNLLNLDTKTKYLFAIGTTFVGNSRTYNFLKTFEHIHKLDPTIKLLSNFDPFFVYNKENLKGKVNPACFKNIINFSSKGYLNSHQLSYYYSAVDACMFMSGDEHAETANCPMRVSSYINGEKIVIINDNNSESSRLLKSYLPEVIDKDLKILAQKAVKMLYSPSLQKKLLVKVKQAKADLSMDNLSKKLIEFYKSI